VNGGSQVRREDNSNERGYVLSHSRSCHCRLQRAIRKCTVTGVGDAFSEPTFENTIEALEESGDLARILHDGGGEKGSGHISRYGDYDLPYGWWARGCAVLLTLFGGTDRAQESTCIRPFFAGRAVGSFRCYQSKSVGRVGLRWWSNMRAIWKGRVRLIDRLGMLSSAQNCTPVVSWLSVATPPVISQRKNSL